VRIHLLSLPHCGTTRAYSLDGFSQVTIRFARMMKGLGHTVILYGSEENEAPCDELVVVISKEEQQSLLGMGPWEYQTANIEEWSPIYQLANSRTAVELGKRKQPKDIICQIGGWSQHYVSDKHPEVPTVEYSIGYQGSFSPYRIFESHVWRHETYGRMEIKDGRFYDDVIPVFFDPSEFTFREKPEDFFLYCGRLVERKGLGIACNAAKAAGVELKVIGHGDKNLITYGTYLGAVSADERNDVMSRARAMFAPTQYIEPFNCAAVESMMCGTPIISTDFGGFTETVKQGKTGFRCHYLGEFVDSVKRIDEIDRKYVHERANRLYSMHNVKFQYQNYFKRLNTLWGDGWNTLTPPDKLPL
jgi:glycosyltransferase involved in cell wall biosynthesis